MSADRSKTSTGSGTALVLNGAPRSGKSSIAAAIAARDPGGWTTAGVDSLRATTPPRLQPGIGLRPGGERPDLEDSIAAMYRRLFADVADRCRVGTSVIVDVGLHDDYSRPLGVLAAAATALEGIDAYLVGVRCPIETIVERRLESGGEYLARGPDGAPAAPVLAWQVAVHRPGVYDIEVDTSVLTPSACATAILARTAEPPTAWARLRDVG